MEVTARINPLTVITLAVALSSLPVTHAWGQEEAWKEEVRKNVSLEREIKSLASDTLSLHDELQELRERAAKAEAKIKAVKQRVQDIKDDIRDESMDAMRREIDSLKVVQEHLREVKAHKDSLYSQLNTDVTNLMMQTKKMSDYAQQSLDANIAVLCRRLSSLTDGQLDEMERTLDLYTATPGFDEYKSQLADTRGKLRLYRRAMEALNSSYDADSVARMRDELIPVLGLSEDLPGEGKFALTDEQYDELDTIDIALSRYRGGVEALKELIAKVNNDDEVRRCRGEHDKAGCIEAIGTLVNATDDATVYVRERYFEMIPYLGKLLQDYWDAVQDDPLTTSHAEELINQLEAE